MMAPIFLIGFMGCGKTTLGRAVSAATGLRFVDLDELIEKEQGASVREIFAERGEAAFRQLETDALSRMTAERDVIVACGGGTPCAAGNMDLMLETGVTVWLKAEPDRLLQRLKEGKSSRPLLAAFDDDELRDFAAGKLAEREPFYSRAHIVFDSSKMDTLDELDASVRNFCELMKLKQNSDE